MLDHGTLLAALAAVRATSRLAVLLTSAVRLPLGMVPFALQRRGRLAAALSLAEAVSLGQLKWRSNPTFIRFDGCVLILPPPIIQLTKASDSNDSKREWLT